MRRLLILALAIALAGCASLRDDMSRAESAYDASDYDASLVWLTDLETQVPDMDMPMRARFYYMRGMTAYRLGKRNDALHYLALAREVAGPRGEGMRAEWQQQMERALTDLTPHDASSAARASTSGGESNAASTTAEGSSSTQH
jgi:uncharacterized protein YceK